MALISAQREHGILLESYIGSFWVVCSWIDLFIIAMDICLIFTVFIFMKNKYKEPTITHVHF